MKVKSEYESGVVYTFSDCAVFADGAVEEAAVQQAANPGVAVPDSCIRIESSPGDARGATERAELLALLSDRVGEFEFRPTDVSVSEARARVPVGIATAGMAPIAAYLAVHGLGNDEIGDWLDIGSRTVSQYLSDFQKGER